LFHRNLSITFQNYIFCLLIAVVAVVPAVDNVPAVSVVPTVEGSSAEGGIAAAIGIRDFAW
jgi:hypothetical protein